MTTTLPAGFYPLLRPVHSPVMDSVGLHTQALFCEHFTLTLIYDHNPALADYAGIMSWTHPSNPASGDYLHTMGIAEVNMVRLLNHHTIITPVRGEGDAILGFTVEGHRHVLALVALPEFIQNMKEALGVRFGMFASSRTFLVAFRLSDNQEIQLWHKVAVGKGRNTLPAAFVVSGDRLSSLESADIPDLVDFRLGNAPKAIGQGSIRPDGAPEVILGEGLQAQTREEHEQSFMPHMKAMRRASVQAAKRQQENQVLDSTPPIPLDAENLAEMGMVAAYDVVAEEARKRYGVLFDDFSERTEDETASYFVTFQGCEHHIDSWEKAAMVLFDVVNRQIKHLPVRFYALNGGNDLHGIFLTPGAYDKAWADTDRVQDRPYLPDLDGMHFPGETMSLDDFIVRVRAVYPNTTLHGLSDTEISVLESRFGIIPEPAKEVFRRIAYSQIDDLSFVGVRDAVDFLPVEYTGPDPDFLVLAMDSNSEFFAVRPRTDWELGRVDHTSGTFETCREGLLDHLASIYLSG
jgi:hypothetical protein